MNTTLQPPATATPGIHPSDHNAVFPMHQHRSSMHAHEHRQQKSDHQRLREVGEASGGTANLNRRRTSAHDHPELFLYPVPLYYALIGGCIAGVGGIVDGGASFADVQCASVHGLFTLLFLGYSITIVSRASSLP